MTETLDDILNTDIIIIGAGLTGLTTAMLLLKQGKSIKIIESRLRLGGRIYTLGFEVNQPIEMGATWLGYKHKHLYDFLNELDVEVFIQELGNNAIFEPISTSPPYLALMPANDEPSLRIKGGSTALIKSLADKVGIKNIHLSEKVLSISKSTNSISVTTDKATYQVEKVISTLPPNLLINTIKFNPELPDELKSVALATHTWMGDSIKVALSYSKPFWKNENSSGTILSNVGPVNEMYDHSNFEKNYYALKGFLNGSFFGISKIERKHMVLKQLKKYFGSVVEDYDNYFEQVWMHEGDTFCSYNEHVLPHQNNGHQIYQQTFLEDRLIIAGSETSPIYPGYMEGAVYSAKTVSNLLGTADS